jgi:tetratricopeptide (TPR) repeat protein
MSKPMAVSLPLVLQLIDWLRGEGLSRNAWQSLLILKAPFVLLALASAAITVAAQGSGGSIAELQAAPLGDRVWVALHALVAYLRNMAWPAGLMPFYPYPESVEWQSARYLGSAALVAAITLAALWNLRRRRYWAFAWGYYVITLIPVLGLVKVGGQAMADRYTYLPSIAPFMALALLLAWGLRRALGKRHGKGITATVPVAVILAIAATLSFHTTRQISIWKDGDTLWTYVIAKNDRIPIAYKHLGISLFERGRYADAARTMERAVGMGPPDPQLLNNLAISYLELGELGKAERTVQRALGVDGDKAYALNTLGEIYLAMEDFESANREFFRAMELEPDNPLRLFNLAVSFDKLNDTEQACTWWRRFMEADLAGEHDVEIRQHLEEIGCPVPGAP